MKKNNVIQFLGLLLSFVTTQSIVQEAAYNVPWTVIGAGPAGIAVVGILCDSGVPPEQIVWIDLEFNVGRIGKYYANVPGNARVQQYINFLKACKTFGECKSAAVDQLFTMPPDMTPPLKFIVNPLLDMTKCLRESTKSLQDELTSLDFHDDQWYVGTKKTLVRSDHVVLATGSHPRELNYEGRPQIPLDVALDKNLLAQHLKPTDRVAVIGSAHSALLIVKYLTELPVAGIINFYKHPIVFPKPSPQGVIWQESGLKGELATWAQKVLLVNPPANLKRILSTQQELKKWLPHCTKVIVAAGFERNDLPAVNSDTSLYDNYDSSSGIIGPRLFGVGIAFPEKRIDPLGNVEYLVGLPFFMPYIQKIIPEWLKKTINSRLYSFDDMFTISIL